MGPTCGRQDPGGPHVGPMNFAIWAFLEDSEKGEITNKNIWDNNLLKHIITWLAWLSL